MIHASPPKSNQPNILPEKIHKNLWLTFEAESSRHSASDYASSHTFLRSVVRLSSVTFVHPA